MKRWGIFFVVGILLAGSVLALRGTVRDPADYTGIWYYAEDETPYLFYNGIIISEKHHLPETEEDIFSGAYSFGKDTIVLFFLTEDGVEQVQKLHLISRKDGDALCEKSERGEIMVFHRTQE